MTMHQARTLSAAPAGIISRESQLPGQNHRPVGPVPDIPVPLRNSPLLLRGGFDIFAGLLDDNTLSRMLAEAVNLAPAAHVNDVPVSDGEEVRGGNPARRFLSVPGGSLQDSFYQADWVLQFLRRVTGVPLAPTGGRGTYTYYARPGDYLALHRDIETCDLAVITCLHDRDERRVTSTNAASEADHAGALCLYPGRVFEPLSRIRETPEQGVIRVRLAPGHTLVLFGGIVPHALQPVTNDQVRIVSVLCYRLYPLAT